jgi:hypothetical protein
MALERKATSAAADFRQRGTNRDRCVVSEIPALIR